MRLICPNCDAEYEVDDAAIPRAGRDVQCSNCGHAWFQVHPEVAAAQAAQAARVVVPKADVTPRPDLPPKPDPTPRPDLTAKPAVTPRPAVTPEPEPEEVLDAALTATAPEAGPSAEYDPKYQLEYGPEEMPDGDMAARFATDPNAAPVPGANPVMSGLPEFEPEFDSVLEPAAKPAAAMGAPEPASAEVKAEPPLARNINESILAVLREEAARETAARRAEAPPALETQTEMSLDPAAARRAAPVAAAPTPVPPPVVPPVAPVVAAPADVAPVMAPVMAPAAVAEPVAEPAVDATRSRRDLLPAIEEINSTLRATSERGGYEDGDLGDPEAAAGRKGGFGRGFLTLVLFGVVLLALYVFAPLIAAKVPALAGAAEAYVAGVDAARVWVDGQIQGLIGKLRGLEGASQG